MNDVKKPRIPVPDLGDKNQRSGFVRIDRRSDLTGDGLFAYYGYEWATASYIQDLYHEFLHHMGFEKVWESVISLGTQS